MMSFHKIIDSFTANFQFDSIFHEAERQFYLQPFKLKKFSIKKTLLNYSQLERKYQIKEIEHWNEQWHKNQRKLFIEFLICYCKLYTTSPERITDDQWTLFSNIFFGKNPMFLKFQGFSIVKLKKKVNWTKQEDELIKQCIKQHGEGNWNQISKRIFFKTKFEKFLSPKQIRQRWFNHLSENIYHGNWKLQQDLIILQHVEKRNKRWCEIVKLLKHTRTQHMIKNRYKFLIKKTSSFKPLRELRIVTLAINKIKKKMQQRGKSAIEDMNKLENKKNIPTYHNICSNTESKEIILNNQPQNQADQPNGNKSQEAQEKQKYELFSSSTLNSQANFNFFLPVSSNNHILCTNYCVETLASTDLFNSHPFYCSLYILPSEYGRVDQSSLLPGLNFWQPYVNSLDVCQQVHNSQIQSHQQ